MLLSDVALDTNSLSKMGFGNGFASKVWGLLHWFTLKHSDFIFAALWCVCVCVCVCWNENIQRAIASIVPSSVLCTALGQENMIAMQSFPCNHIDCTTNCETWEFMIAGLYRMQSIAWFNVSIQRGHSGHSSFITPTPPCVEIIRDPLPGPGSYNPDEVLERNRPHLLFYQYCDYNTIQYNAIQFITSSASLIHFISFTPCSFLHTSAFSIRNLCYDSVQGKEKGWRFSFLLVGFRAFCFLVVHWLF